MSEEKLTPEEYALKLKDAYGRWEKTKERQFIANTDGSRIILSPENTLSVELVALFLESKDSNCKCPVCGSDHFGIHATKDICGVFTSDLHPSIVVSGPQDSGKLPMIRSECDNCGHLFHFSLESIREKIKSTIDSIGNDNEE